MKYINNYKTFENVSQLVKPGKKEYDLNDIRSCFVELEDENFNINIKVGYLKFSRHFSEVRDGLEISIKKGDYFIVDSIIENLEISQEYIENKYNVKLDFISKPRYKSIDINDITQYNFPVKDIVSSFSEIGGLEVSSLYIHFRPINNFDKIKTYIKNKLK